jgi:NAD(P)-dependent dehydrogenase (short-subunit alcohol dehydrogenase family)
VITIDCTGKNVLITGGTKGIGYATARQFARAGARLFLTYKWGSASEEEIVKEFESLDAPKPVFIQADASIEEDTEGVMEQIRGAGAEGVDIFINNVGFAARTMELKDYKKRSLFKTFEYSSWPIVDYTRKIEETFGRYPAYIIGISSDGPDHYYPGYDFVAASKALLEFLGRYLAAHLGPNGTKVNVIRFGMVNTESFGLIFGNEFFDYMEKQGLPKEMVLTPEECGKVVLAFCSGFMDAVNGQVIQADYGLPFRDNTMNRFLSQKEE